MRQVEVPSWIVEIELIKIQSSHGNTFLSSVKCVHFHLLCVFLRFDFSARIASYCYMTATTRTPTVPVECLADAHARII